MIQLQNKVTELEEELLKAKEQLRLVRNELEQDKQGLQQVREEENKYNYEMTVVLTYMYYCTIILLYSLLTMY